MDPPTMTVGKSSATTTRIVASRSSMIDSLRGCGLSGVRIDKEVLRKKLVMPEYLRRAMADAIKSKDAAEACDRHHSTSEVRVPEEAPHCAMVVFVNSKSGGRHGPELKLRLQQLISEEQVFDLSDVKPHEFVKHGLMCIEKMAVLGDLCAKECREKMRIMVAGGDGTVGWVLGSLAELNKEGRQPIPPVGVIPLGTGNDLSRSFGWGGSFPFAWKSGVKRSLDRAIAGPVCRLDSWQVVVSMAEGQVVDAPHSLKATEECHLDQGLEVEGQMPEKMACYEGVFYNYFSIGMDAQVAYGFHHLRNEKPYLAQGPIANKLIYSSYSCTQGWFLTPCISNPSLRGLKNVIRMHIKKVNCSEWEQIPVPKSVRAIVCLNLHNYGSGRNPWGKPSAGYMEKKGFVEAHVDDGLIEIFGLKQGWHASFVMVELISAKHIAQAAAIRLEQPMSKEYSSFVEIRRVPHQSVMINGD
ncbi:Diacylglycerol kinase 7 [Linum grandiflorum]